MKKLLACILSAFVLLTFCSANQKEAAGKALTGSGRPAEPEKEIKSVQIQADTLYNPKTLAEVEEKSSFIVRGKLENDAREKLQQFDGTPYFGITVSSLRITKVHKGNLQIGDTISLGENYYTMGNEQNKTIYHFGNYMPSTVGQEYLFLLVDYPEGGEWWNGIYLPMYSENGRFPVLAQNQINARSMQSLTNQDLNLGEDDSSVYRSIYKEVLAKYMS